MRKCSSTRVLFSSSLCNGDHKEKDLSHDHTIQSELAGNLTVLFRKFALELETLPEKLHLL